MVTVHGDCPNFRGGHDVALENTLSRRENGTVPLGRKGTGTFFGRQALMRRDGETGRKMSQSPAACERLRKTKSGRSAGGPSPDYPPRERAKRTRFVRARAEIDGTRGNLTMEVGPGWDREWYRSRTACRFGNLFRLEWKTTPRIRHGLRFAPGVAKREMSRSVPRAIRYLRRIPKFGGIW